LCILHGMDARHYYPEKLVRMREDAELSQEALAEEFGVHKLTILRAEKGRSASYGLLSKYADRFTVAVTDLLRPHPAQTIESAQPAEAAA
jgi:transcriptional regulator with XRE-family HTH domain